MLEIFKGWRRKVGCITLVIAALVAGEWARSFQTQDQFIFRDSKRIHFVTSAHGAVTWEAILNDSAMNDKRSYPAGWSSERALEHRTDIYENVDIEWRCRGFGFDCGAGRVKLRNNLSIVRLSVWITPYWSLVLPLTVLSAYLILWKPRK